MDLFAFFQEFNVNLLFKIPLLLLQFLFFIFTLILLNQTRALARIIHVNAKSASFFIRLLVLSYAVAVLSLFLISLVIL
jgi:hypothetical protein